MGRRTPWIIQTGSGGQEGGQYTCFICKGEGGGALNEPAGWGWGGAWLSLLMAVVLFIPRLITVIITIITLTTPRSCSCHSPRASSQTPSPAHSSFHHFHPVLFRRSFVCRVVCKPPSSLPRCQIFYRLSVKYEITEAKDIYYIKKKSWFKKTKKLCEWRPPLKIYLVSDNFSCPLFLSSFLFYLWFFFSSLFLCIIGVGRVGLDWGFRRGSQGPIISFYLIANCLFLSCCFFSTLLCHYGSPCSFSFFLCFLKRDWRVTPASPSPKHLSLKPTVKPSHSLLFFLTRSSDASVEVMKSIFIWSFT